MRHNTEPFGFFHPPFAASCLLFLVKLGLGAGPLKRLFYRIYATFHHGRPVDLCYHGLKMRLYPHNNTIDRKILFSSKMREKREIQAIKEAINPDAVFVDIGANIGYYALTASKLGCAKTLAIEPNPEIIERLRDHVAFNGFEDTMHVAQCGVGDQPGSMQLHISQSDMGGSSAVTANGDAKQTADIPIKPLVDIMAETQITHIDLLKIDIEGMEDKALFPYFKAIDHSQYPRLIIIEDNSDLWEQNILKWLLENAYEIQLKTRSNLVLRLREPASATNTTAKLEYEAA